MDITTQEEWLSTQAFAEKVGISLRTAERVISDAIQHGMMWRGVRLNVRQVSYRGRLVNRVLKSSLPPEFLKDLIPVADKYKLIENKEFEHRTGEGTAGYVPDIDLDTAIEFEDPLNWSGDWCTISQDFGATSGLPNIHAGFSLKTNSEGDCYITSSMSGMQFCESIGNTLMPTERTSRHTNYKIELSSADIESATPRFLQLEGSYSTVVTVRSYNGKLEFSGNPSRFNRDNNIIGYSIPDMVHVINTKILPLLTDLPTWARFTAGKRGFRNDTRVIKLTDYYDKKLGIYDKAAYVRACKAHENYLDTNKNVLKPYRIFQDKVPASGMKDWRVTNYEWQELYYTGATFSRLDLNLNIAFGSLIAVDTFLSHCARVSLGRLSPRLEGRSVYYGSKSRKHNGYISLKVYDKYREFIAHADEDFKETARYKEICEYLLHEAIARVEMGAYREFLRQHGLLYLGNFEGIEDGQQELIRLTLERIQPLLSKDLETIDMEELTRVELAIYNDWLAGNYIPDYMTQITTSGKPRLSQSTYYRIKAAIEAKTKINIAIRRDIENETVPPQTTTLIFMRPARKIPAITPPAVERETTKLRLVGGN